MTMNGTPARRMLSALVAFAAAAILASCQIGPWARGPVALSPTVSVPDSFLVAFETSRGRVEIMAREAWSPAGVDRFYVLVREHYYDDARFFRVVKNFVAQFGIAGDPKLSAAWHVRRLADEPVKHTNARGTISYARGGAGTRTVQLYINLKDNARLDSLNGFGFPPIAEVVSGMSVVDSLYSGYGESKPRGTGPSQDSIQARGNAYLVHGWPKLDYIKTARVIREWRSPRRITDE
jgi:peptidyl-prolyl cis-trans isomerase A (cyclophilin A)